VQTPLDTGMQCRGVRAHRIYHAFLQDEASPFLCRVVLLRVMRTVAGRPGEACSTEIVGWSALSWMENPVRGTIMPWSCYLVTM